jgi:hypothetical protein
VPHPEGAWAREGWGHNQNGKVHPFAASTCFCLRFSSCHPRGGSAFVVAVLLEQPSKLVKPYKQLPINNIKMHINSFQIHTIEIGEEVKGKSGPKAQNLPFSKHMVQESH